MVQGIVFRVLSLGLRVHDSLFMVIGFRVWGSGFRVYGLGFMV